MDKKNKFPFFIIISIIVILSGVLMMHASRDLTVLYPSGWIAIQERNLIFIVSSVMLLVVLPVLFMTIYFGWKYRAGRNEKYHPEWDDNKKLEMIWWGVPALIIVGFSYLTWHSSHELDPYKPIQSDKKAIEIQVVALNWKWLFIYPEEGIATVNYIQFPEDTPIHLEITADAPMNSFWLPALGGQMYAMPGMRGELNLIADKQGQFKGRSANISGTGFAGMVFTAVSGSDAEFQQWIRQVRNSGGRLDYNELVKDSSYVPTAYYVLNDRNLFDQIIMKYMSPMDKK